MNEILSHLWYQKSKLALLWRLFQNVKPICLSFHKNKFKSVEDVSNHITKITNLTGLEIEMLEENANLSDWMSLSVLTDLQYLKVLQNNDTIPHDLYAHLKGLTVLEDFCTKDLSHLTCLQSLSALARLEVNCKRQYNPFNIAPCPEKLTSLSVIGKNFNWNEADLAHYSGLKDLIYDETNSSQLFPVGKLSNLESLGITANDIDEYPANLTSLSVQQVSSHNLTKLTKLKNLRINSTNSESNNEEKQVLKYINSVGLTELILNDCCSTEDFTRLMKFTELICLRLTIHSGQIDVGTFSEAINSLKKLAELDIRLPTKAKMTLEISTNLMNLEKIESYGGQVLFFENPSVMTALKSMPADPKKLRNITQLGSLTRLECLDRISLTPPVISELTKLEHLTSMRIWDGNFESMNSIIGKFTKLESMNMDSVKGVDFEKWTDLKNLTYLDIEVDDLKALDKLYCLTSLQVLYMMFDSSTISDFRKEPLLEKLPNLYSIELSYY